MNDNTIEEPYIITNLINNPHGYHFESPIDAKYDEVTNEPIELDVPLYANGEIRLIMKDAEYTTDLPTVFIEVEYLDRVIVDDNFDDLHNYSYALDSNNSIIWVSKTEKITADLFEDISDIMTKFVIGKKVTVMDNYAFNNCDSINVLYAVDSKVKELAMQTYHTDNVYIEKALSLDLLIQFLVDKLYSV